MSRLFRLKEWLTPQEAADHLTSVLSEAVTVADIYRLALSKRLTLSANFVNHATANIGIPVPHERAEFRVFPRELSKWGEMSSQYKRPFPKRGRDEQEAWLAEHKELVESDDVIIAGTGLLLPDGMVLQLEDTVTSIQGVWDLTMHGGERLDVEHLLQQELGGPEITLTSLEGAFVYRDGRYARILEHNSENPYMDQSKKYPYGDPDSYYPSGGLPDDAPLVVRVDALADFLRSLNEPQSAKDLDARERVTLLAIIGALVNEVGLDLAKPHKAGENIAGMLSRQAIKISPRTIGEHLKAVREAMESRQA